MPIVLLPLSGFGIPTRREKTYKFNNLKTQRNPITGDIEEYGVSGDVAGIIIQKLNSQNFEEIEGKTKSSVKNILSVNEYDNDEWVALQSDCFNVIERSGDSYFIRGNKMDSLDQDSLLAKANIYLIFMFINVKLSLFLEAQISEEGSLENKVRAKLEEIKKGVSRYVKTFDFQLRVDGRKIQIDLYEDVNKPIIRMKMFVNSV